MTTLTRREAEAAMPQIDTKTAAQYIGSIIGGTYSDCPLCGDSTYDHNCIEEYPNYFLDDCRQIKSLLAWAAKQSKDFQDEYGAFLLAERHFQRDDSDDTEYNIWLLTSDNKTIAGALWCTLRHLGRVPMLGVSLRK